MPLLRPAPRKALLAVHLVASIGWIGAVICYLALGGAAVLSDDATTMRAAWWGMELLGWWVIVPLAVTTLLTGIALSLFTRWGLLRHYWVVTALVITAVCTGVLVFHMPDVSATAEHARTADAATLEGFGGDLSHPAIGLVLLLLVLVLNLYKPQGLTRYGWRRQHQR
jgi:hypothetical protein